MGGTGAKKRAQYDKGYQFTFHLSSPLRTDLPAKKYSAMPVPPIRKKNLFYPEENHSL